MGTLSELHPDGTVLIGSKEFRADTLADKSTKEPGPETYSDEAEAWRESKAKVCRALLASDVTGYLSQWEGEQQDEYETRQKGSVWSFVNWYEDAVGGLVDQVFSAELLLTFPDEAPAGEVEQVKAFWENVERRKRTPVDGTQFARTTSEMSLGYGGTPVILIDFPERAAPAADKASEDAQGLTPYFSRIHPWNLIDVDVSDDGHIKQVRYFSTQTTHGEWATTKTPTVVVLDRGATPGSFATRRVFVQSDDDKKEYKHDSKQDRTFQGPTNAPGMLERFREIPVVGVPTGKRCWWAPPMLENVATLNILHYRKRTDYDVAEAVSSVPVNAFFGFSAEELQAIQWGPFRTVRTKNPPSDAAVQDISFGFETAETSLKTLASIERYIAVKSKDPQSQRATGEEKSTIRLLDEAKKISRLQAWALGWLASYQAALGWAGAWMGLEEVGTLNYLDEVFEALSTAPTWADYTGWVTVALDLPSELLPFHIAEGKRFDIISDEHDDQMLLKTLEAAASGGGLDAEE